MEQRYSSLLSCMTQGFRWLIVLHTGLDLLFSVPFHLIHSVGLTAFRGPLLRWHAAQDSSSSLYLCLSILCQKTGEEDIFSWDAGMFLQSLFCVVFAEAYLDLEACKVWAGAMLFSSICSRVAFVQRETLLTEPVVAPERDRKGKREGDQLDVSESSFLTFPVYCIFEVVLESVNTIQVLAVAFSLLVWFAQ